MDALVEEGGLDPCLGHQDAGGEEVGYAFGRFRLGQVATPGDPDRSVADWVIDDVLELVAQRVALPQVILQRVDGDHPVTAVPMS